MSDNGLEAGDINDKEILDETKQESNSRGFIRWKYTFSDGRSPEFIQSEWIDRDNARKAIFSWLELVRNSLVSRAHDARSEANAAARRATAEALRVAEEAAQSDSRIDNDIMELVGVPAPRPKAGAIYVPDSVQPALHSTDPVVRALQLRRMELASELAKLDAAISIFLK